MPEINAPRPRDGQDSTCRHHWVIGTPAGPTSEGRCKLCGTSRSFNNVFEDVIQSREARAA
jgi:hypothetical protein